MGKALFMCIHFCCDRLICEFIYNNVGYYARFDIYFYAGFG